MHDRFAKLHICYKWSISLACSRVNLGDEDVTSIISGENAIMYHAVDQHYGEVLIIAS